MEIVKHKDLKGLNGGAMDLLYIISVTHQQMHIYSL